MRLKKRHPSLGQAPEPREKFEEIKFKKHAGTGVCVICEASFAAKEGYEVPLALMLTLILTSSDTRVLSASQHIYNLTTANPTVCADCLRHFQAVGRG
jgi:hypothetical protein